MSSCTLRDDQAQRRAARPCGRGTRCTSSKLWPVSTCMTGNGSGAGQNAFAARCSMTTESLPPENSRTGRSNSAATSRKMWIASASSARGATARRSWSWRPARLKVDLTSSTISHDAHVARSRPRPPTTTRLAHELATRAGELLRRAAGRGRARRPTSGGACATTATSGSHHFLVDALPRGPARRPRAVRGGGRGPPPPRRPPGVDRRPARRHPGVRRARPRPTGPCTSPW